MSHLIQGLIAAPFTPLKGDGNLNLAVIERYAKQLKGDGVKGVFVCGTTGEGLSLTMDERKLLLEEWLRHQEPDFKVISHVGSTSGHQSAGLARHAAKQGAFAISAMGPPYFQPKRVEELVGYCHEIAREAPGIPFYYYHIPAISGVRLPMPLFLTKGQELIPSLQGIKFTDHNLMELQQCMMVGEGRMEVLLGYDEALLGGLALGIQAAVGSTYNFMAPVYYRIMSCFANGDYRRARQLQRYAVKVVEIMQNYGGWVVAGKAIQSFCGIDCGPCRLPLSSIAGEELQRLRRDLEGIGFFRIRKDPDHFGPEVPGSG
jgi:N-acetylneuraminate lyase